MTTVNEKSPVNATKAYEGVEVYVHSFLTSAALQREKSPLPVPTKYEASDGHITEMC
jgi:hypothetical protein